MLITSAALILLVTLLRLLFRRAIPRRAQYAMWGLVLLRLLVPFNLPAAEYSVLSAARPINMMITETLPAFASEEETAPESLAPPQEPESYERQAAPESGEAEEAAPAKSAARRLAAADILRGAYAVGALAAAAWLLTANLRFARRLRRTRVRLEGAESRYPVWLCDDIPSPCLFGLPRPAIYVTSEAAKDKARLRYVIAHEETHARHLDPLWALLRGLCLVLWWFHPLVWLAAHFSKIDCELACDEGVLARLGKNERVAYGETLLALVPVRHGSSPMLTATTMTAGKRQMKERISRIAAHKRPVMVAVLPAALLLAGACALTFTAAKQPETCPLTAEELKYFSESFFSSLKDGINLRNQFLGVLYEKPEDIDLFELFYAGTGTYNVVLPEDPEYPLVGTEICDTTRMPTAELDAAFYAATGVHIEQTKKKGLANFRYLPEYDAYYHTHGDTNYFGSVEIAAGMREGEMVRLWYFDAFRGGGWKCVTLRETAEGGWHFVSNLKAEKPVVPTVYPEGEPWAVLPTDGMEPRLAADIGEAADEDIYHIDLDGDGTDEFISGSKLLLGRGSLTYEADIRELISAAFGNTKIVLERAYADRYRRCIVAEGVVQRGQYNWPTFRRYIYFNGENLLIYKADITHTGNIMDGVSAPTEVLRDAGAEAKAAAWRLMARDSGDAHEWLDDWCVSALELTEVRRERYTVEIYRLGVLFHASDPQKVVLAGGMGLTEDDWVSGVSEAPAFLLYAVTPDGARRRLDVDIPWEMGPQNETAFPMELAYVELMNGLCKPSELSGTELARLFIQRWYGWDDIMNWMGAAGEAEYTDAIQRMINAAEENGEWEALERAVFLRFAQSSLPNLTDEGKKANRYMTELVMPTQTE